MRKAIRELVPREWAAAQDSASIILHLQDGRILYTKAVRNARAGIKEHRFRRRSNNVVLY
jgi:hypothetical protein